MNLIEQLRKTGNHADDFNFASNLVAMQKGDHISVPLTDNLRHTILGASEYCDAAADRIEVLEGAIKVWCETCDHRNEACALCPLHDALNPDKPKQNELPGLDDIAVPPCG